MADNVETVDETDARAVPPAGTTGTGDAGDKPTPAATPAPDTQGLEALRAENARLRELSEKASRDAAGAQAYVHEIVSRLQAAANSRSEAPETPGRDIREVFQEDPVSVLDQHFQARMAPLINQSLEYQVQSAQELFSQRMAENEDYKDYKDELDEFMKGIPPAVKAQPKAWVDGLNFIRARHLDDIVEKRRKKQTENDRRAFVEPASAAGARREGGVTLNADQKAIAKGLGIPEEEYVKWLTA